MRENHKIMDKDTNRARTLKQKKSRLKLGEKEQIEKLAEISPRFKALDTIARARGKDSVLSKKQEQFLDDFKYRLTQA